MARQLDDAMPEVEISDGPLDLDSTRLASTNRAVLVQQPPADWHRLTMSIFGVIFPTLLWIVVTVDEAPHSTSLWQSGRPSVFATLLLSSTSSWPFWPLMLLAMSGLASYAIRPKLSNRWWLRAAIVSGLLVSGQFLIITVVAEPLFLIAGSIVSVITYLVVSVCSRFLVSFRRFEIWYIMYLTALVAVVFAVLRATGVPSTVIFQFGLGIGMLALFATPLLCFFTYCVATNLVLSNLPTPPVKYRNGYIGAWILTYLGAWKLAIDSMLSQYNKLPTSDPSCFVCSAAAHGHRRLVGSRQIGPMIVNSQMQYLKFFEFLFAVTFPKVHVQLRRVYNRVGPTIAARVREQPWLADACYLAFLPAECSARLIARIGGFDASKIRNLFLPNSTYSND